MKNMEQAALEAAINTAPAEAEAHDTIPDVPPTLEGPTAPEDTVREPKGEKGLDYKSAEAGLGTAAKVMEQPIIQEGANAWADQLDGSWAMKPFEKVWNLMPKSMQEGIAHPVTGFVTSATPLGFPVQWLHQLEKAGLLQIKGHEDADVSQQEKQKTEQELRAAAGEVAKIASGGEASGLVEVVKKVLGAHDEILAGMRVHLAETRAKKKAEELRHGIEKTA